MGINWRWWTYWHPLTRITVFLVACIAIVMVDNITISALLAVTMLGFVVACGAIRTNMRFLLWAHLLGLPGVVLLFVIAGYEKSHSFATAWTLGFPEACHYILRVEALFLANLALIGTTTMRELASLTSYRWIPKPVAVLLSTAIRFVPLSINEARRIHEIQRCRGLRLRPWSPRTWLPVIVPLFIGQMWRTHETTLMLTVRRMSDGVTPAARRRLALQDWLIFSLLAIGGLIALTLWFVNGEKYNGG